MWLIIGRFPVGQSLRPERNLEVIKGSICSQAGLAKAVQIYNNTEDAIIQAQARQVPIIVCSGVAYPDDIVSEIPCL